MQLLHEICQQQSKWKPLEDYILRIETYPDNGPMVVDNCKCIIESICKTILEDLGVDKSQHKTKIHELAKQTIEKLGCISKSGELVSALINTAQKIGEFRNEYTETGHGQSVYALEENRKNVAGATITFLIAIIEQTALFLIAIYQNEYPQHIQKQLLYENNPEFNEEFDELIEPIQIDRYGPYSPSELLFNIDIDAYRTALSNYLAD